jgi:hypothetical protein
MNAFAATTLARSTSCLFVCLFVLFLACLLSLLFGWYFNKKLLGPPTVCKF